MNRQLTKVLSTFIPGKEHRRAFRRRHANFSPSITVSNVGKVYLPLYHQGAHYDEKEPEIFNRFGEPVRTLFVRDFHSSFRCALAGRYLYWDKYNFGLKNHLYTHRAMLETIGAPDHRFGALMETPGITPEDYRIFDENPGLEKDFDLVFTYDLRLLDRMTNARFVPFCAGIKLNFSDIEGSLALMRDDLHQEKSLNVSILSSAKVSAPLHRLRKEFAEYAKRNACCDTYGNFDGGTFVRAFDTLADYRFSVVIENTLEECTFTEKLTNCFACQTIPIYIGPRGVSRFFNMDGIIQVKDLSMRGIVDALKCCTEQEYKDRLGPVMDNYRRVQEYRNIDDMMFLQHLKGLI